MSRLREGPSILFVPPHAASAREHLHIARRIQSDGVYAPAFLLETPLTEPLRRDVAEAGVRMIGPASDLPGQTVVTHVRERVPRFAASLARTVPQDLKLATAGLLHFSALLRAARRILVHERVVGLILAGDRQMGWETALVREANRLRIPSLIVPFALSDADSAAWYRTRDAKFHDSLGLSTHFRRRVARTFPRWVHNYRGTPLFFNPPGSALAAWALGMMPANPWAVAGGDATRVAVESDWVFRLLLRQGVPAEKMVVTGKPALDTSLLSAGSRRALRADLGVADDRPIVLCAVPQLAEHNFLPWPKHWEEIEFLLSVLAGVEGARVVLSLHPKSDRAAYEPLAEKFGMIVGERPTYELLQACDAYVATFSSTVMQAIAFHRPCVIIDFYHFNYRIYDGAPGVLHVRDRQLLAPTLNRLVHDKDHRRSLSLAQERAAGDWAILDGRSTDRVIDLLYGLVARGGGVGR